MDTRIASTCLMKICFACDVAERALGITNDFRHMIRWTLDASFVSRHSFDASHSCVYSSGRNSHDQVRWQILKKRQS